MKVCLFVILCWFLGFGNSIQVKIWPVTHYTTKIKSDITIKIKVHFDQKLTSKLPKESIFTTIKKLKVITKKILDDTKRLFRQSKLHQTVNFNLLEIGSVANNEVLPINQDSAKYLKSYCDWQTTEKLASNIIYYSVLFTGLDLYSISKDGKKNKSNTGRSYLRGMCSIKKSCSVIEWNPKTVSFLLAHEIGHSLSINHDGPPYNSCDNQKDIMATKYKAWRHPRSWSSCSQFALQRYLRSRNSRCIRSNK